MNSRDVEEGCALLLALATILLVAALWFMANAHGRAQGECGARGGEYIEGRCIVVGKIIELEGK